MRVRDTMPGSLQQVGAQRQFWKLIWVGRAAYSFLDFSGLYTARSFSLDRLVLHFSLPRTVLLNGHA